jgi:photosystem II P680 reaction center D1 protein
MSFVLLIAIISIMTTTLQQQQSASLGESFCQWVTSTGTRLYIGWFAVLMSPTLLEATACYVIKRTNLIRKG